MFLPGAGEIRRARRRWRSCRRAGDLLILPLHGDLPLEEQDRAVRPANRRKIILATNVAETSVTIDGVVGVIDSGLARIATHSPWTGLPTLALGKISQAAATQRAGRAGRTRAGRALRLHTRHDFEQRRGHDQPEIARSDLAELALGLATLGVADADALSWLEPPPAAAWGVARELLARLGAIDGAGALTDVGRRMARLPVHPRLARLVVEGETRGVGDAACLAAALDLRARHSHRGPRLFATAERAGLERGAEVVDPVDLFQEAERARFGGDVVRRLELDCRALDEVARVPQLAAGLARRTGAGRCPNDSAALRQAVLAAFPDRVARRRTDERRAVVLAAGGSASLGFEASHDWRWRSTSRSASAEPARAVSRCGSARRLSPSGCWISSPNASRRSTAAPSTRPPPASSGRAASATAPCCSTRPSPPRRRTRRRRLLAAAAVARGLDQLPGGDALPELLQRLVFARTAVPDAPLPPLDTAGVAELVRVACQGQVGFWGLTDLRTLVLAALPGDARRALERRGRPSASRSGAAARSP